MENLRNPRVLGTQYRVYDKDGKYKRTIDKTDEKNLDESDWLKGVTCFVINEKGEVLIEVRANKGLTPGKNDLCSGHLDNDETETQAMVRELKEETGAVDFNIKPVCVYSVKGKTRVNENAAKESFGMLYAAEIFSFEEIHSEIEKIVLSDDLIRQWTYPLIQPKLISEAKKRGYL